MALLSTNSCLSLKSPNLHHPAAGFFLGNDKAISDCSSSPNFSIQSCGVSISYLLQSKIQSLIWFSSKRFPRLFFIALAEVIRECSDITLIGWGAQLSIMEQACVEVKKDDISCELIDLKTLIPWDKETVEASVNKTGRLLISHEAPVTDGFGAEISASIVERCLLRNYQILELPVF